MENLEGIEDTNNVNTFNYNRNPSQKDWNQDNIGGGAEEEYEHLFSNLPSDPKTSRDT